LTTGEVLDTGEVATSEQFTRNQLELRAINERGRTTRTIRNPTCFGAFTPNNPQPAPLLGQHQNILPSADGDGEYSALPQLDDDLERR
jgi:crotonobetainyl-CoA:carnitine CoA-transferase CaiB-like acyl-CoA transferase